MIEKYSFGSMTVNGRPMRHDVKIIRGRAEDGWWRKSGHLAALGDMRDIFEAAPEVLVIGTGASGMMKVDASVRDAAGKAGIRLIIKPTAQAVEEFNTLERSGVHAAGAFHLTC